MTNIKMETMSKSEIMDILFCQIKIRKMELEESNNKFHKEHGVFSCRLNKRIDECEKQLDEIKFHMLNNEI